MLNPVEPVIHVIFAGKGSRLLQWLTTTHPAAATDFYTDLFKLGYRGTSDEDNDNAPRYHDLIIELPKIENSKNIKYEVSKGLAKNNSDLCNPADDTPSEIIGETGFTLAAPDGYTYPLSYVNTITPQMIENIGKRFNPSRNGEQSELFYNFCNTFYSAAQRLFDMDISKEVFIEGLDKMNIVQYVQNMPEYLEAARDKEKNNGNFDFVAPIIILEGMKFYDDYLLKSLKKDE